MERAFLPYQKDATLPSTRRDSCAGGRSSRLALISPVARFQREHNCHQLLQQNQLQAERRQRRRPYFFSAVRMSCSYIKMMKLAAVKAVACPEGFLAPLRN